MVTRRMARLIPALLALLVVGCGGKASTQGPAGTIVIEGTISLRGSTPKPMVFIETKEGVEMSVRGEDDLLAELQGLSGFPVAIRGHVKKPDDRVPSLEALRYELLRLPSGERPVIGMLSVEGSWLVLVAPDGSRYWIRGDLVGAIREYDGAKVWVVGSLGDAAMQTQPRDSIAYWVTGYGVLRDAPQAGR